MKKIIAFVLLAVFVLSLSIEAFCDFDLSLFENNDNYTVVIDDMDDTGYFYPNDVFISLESADLNTPVTNIMFTGIGKVVAPMLNFDIAKDGIYNPTSFIIKTDKHRYTVEEGNLDNEKAFVIFWNDELFDMIHELATATEAPKFRILADKQIDGTIIVSNKEVLEQYYNDFLSAGGFNQSNIAAIGGSVSYKIKNLEDGTEIAFEGLSPSTSTAKSPGKAKNDPTISLEEYNKIKKGMTYEQVVEIIGSEGKLELEFDLGEFGGKTQSYSWDGTGYGSASFTFQNGKLEQMFQIMLE